MQPQSQLRMLNSKIFIPRKRLDLNVVSDGQCVNALDLRVVLQKAITLSEV